MSGNVDIDQIISILSNLNFIAKIKAGQKIDVQNKMMMENTIYNNFFRHMNGTESRAKSFDYIKEVCSNALGYIKSLSKRTDDKSKQYLTKLCDALKKAEEGIKNLADTYKKDIMFCSSSDAYVEHIEVELTLLTDK